MINLPIGAGMFRRPPAARMRGRHTPLVQLSPKLRRLTDRLMYWVFTLCGMFAVAAVLGISTYLILAGAPAVREIGLMEFLFGAEWNPSAPNPSFGILPMILSSSVGTALSVLLALPVGVMTAVFLTEAPKSVSWLMRPAVELMSGIPSVIYGMVGSLLLVPQVRRLENVLFQGNKSHIFTGGANLLSAAVVLAVMILPTVIHISELSLRAVSREIWEGSLALGTTRMETILCAVLPAARQGILSGVILGIGRAMGEAMAVIMVSGNAVHFPLPFNSVRLLAGGIAVEMSYSSGLHRKALFSIGLVLFVMLLLVNLLLETALKQREDR